VGDSVPVATATYVALHADELYFAEAIGTSLRTRLTALVS
jgi:hypothetical protein